MFEMPDPFGRPKPGVRGSSSSSMSRGQARAWAAGMEMVYGLVGMGLVGFAVDYFAGTMPRWTLILALVGLAWGMYRFIRVALVINSESSLSIRGRTFLKIGDDEPDDAPGDAPAPGDNPGDPGGSEPERMTDETGKR